MTAPALSRRVEARAVVCVCSRIRPQFRPCLACRPRAVPAPKPRLWADLPPVERFAVVVAVAIWLAVVVAIVVYVRGAS